MSHELGAVHVQGRALQCLVCAHDSFWEREMQLASPVAALFAPGEERSAHCAVCARCGYVHMFIPPATIPVESDAPAGGPLPQAAA